ncbi:MAG: Nif3-like dinuclear metal center hexameric protein [Bacteroidetes bacterium]|nr:Nif3-like dinuclear metal center hexameric protein [Bacteroidota bacterium]MBS1972903.1 Nif3-like dinuclear metal center hexameric protein [Bacteroidota bacterium]
MKISNIIAHLETIAPPAYQENYDNAGLLTGMPEQECTGVLTALDCTEEIIQEAISMKCNLVVVHHPIIFGGLKKIIGKNYVEKAVIAAIKNDITIYAIHTNLDNVLHGVNSRIADKLGLINRKILLPKEATIKKLCTFVPIADLEKVRTAIFNAGGGNIGDYSEAGFSVEGHGSFKAGLQASPFVGKIGERHYENEARFETIFPAYLQKQIVAALIGAHPYEEVAYDIVELANSNNRIGSGLIGELHGPIDEKAFLHKIKHSFLLAVIKHTRLLGKQARRIAICGGAGSFLIPKALAAGADFYITSDIRYHEFFEAQDRMVVADIGHYESEQYTIDLLYDILVEKFPNFAVLKTGLITNPVHYFL